MASGLERYFTYALRAFAPELPPPVKEFRAVPDRKFRYDFAWPDPPAKLLVEIQGGTWMRRSGY